ncbi:hypothetical protein PG995_003281 [Apiospora arundinis]
MSATVTEFAGYTRANYGPLTTTFTADPSCATAAADQLLIVQGNDINKVVGPPKCITRNKDFASCYPSGSKVNSMVSESLWGLGYFSPGVACPSGWSTAGVMARATGTKGEKLDGWNGTGSLSGDDVWIKDDNEWLHGVPMLEMYRQMMTPEETMAVCCPSGYQAANNARNCMSSITPLTALKDWDGKICNGGTYVQASSYATATIVISGSVTTEVWSAVTSGPGGGASTWESTTMMPLSNLYGYESLTTRDMTVMTVLDSVPLIHRASDVKPNAAASSLTPMSGGSVLTLLPLVTVVLSMLGGARSLFR